MLFSTSVICSIDVWSCFPPQSRSCMSRADNGGGGGGGGAGVSSNPLSNFIKLRKLGEGGFGQVFLVRDSRDGVSYVMKEVDLSKLDAKGRKDATKECAFLARMAHPNIITYKEFFEVAGAPQGHLAGPWNLAAWQAKGAAAIGAGGASRGASTLYIIMSYADGGDLEARIKAQQKLGGVGGKFVPFPEQQIIDWFIQTALAIKHIHDRKILSVGSCTLTHTHTRASEHAVPQPPLTRFSLLRAVALCACVVIGE